MNINNYLENIRSDLNLLKDSTCVEDAEEIHESICVHESGQHLFMNDKNKRKPQTF